MVKEKLFDKTLGFELDSFDKDQMVSVQLSKNSIDELKPYLIAFPEDLIVGYIGRVDYENLNINLNKRWKSSLPVGIHNSCPVLNNNAKSTNDKNCFQYLLSFQILYHLSGYHFGILISANRDILSKESIINLIRLFFSNSFFFQDGKAFFKVGEMCKYLIQTGLMDVSNQLKGLEVKVALGIANENLTTSKMSQIISNDGFEDVEQIESEFWKIQKDCYKTKLDIEESSVLSFLDNVIRGIHTLQRDECHYLKSTSANTEFDYRNFFKMVLHQVYLSVEAEPEKEKGRIDLKITDSKLNSSKIIEFKGWWNSDRVNIVNQLLSYLTDFEDEGYIFMINRNKKKMILNEYRIIVTDAKCGFVINSWKEHYYKETGYLYYSSKYNVNGKTKTIFHFIYNQQQ